MTLQFFNFGDYQISRDLAPCPILHLTDKFSDASTEHTYSFIFYWLAQFVSLGSILEQDVGKWSLNWKRGKLIFYTIGMKHCI